MANADRFFENIFLLTLDAAPWLLFGFVIAGFIHAWVPNDGLARFLGGRGLGAIVTGAIIGAPLPICSCGVLPTVISLRRSGASREASTSFLVATPETGVDSVALSYAMLGPFMAISRPIAAISSAIITGLLMKFLPPEADNAQNPEETDDCCSSHCCGDKDKPHNHSHSSPTFIGRTVNGISYALVEIFEDVALWLLVGLVLAAATLTWVPPEALADYGQGISAMVIMVLVGIPMYICATSSTPVAASLLLAGVSPGAAMVFMLAGPATNIATLGVVRREMGNKGVGLYLGGIIISAIAAGLLTDFVADSLNIDMTVQLSNEDDFVPFWLSLGSAGILLLLGLKMFVGTLTNLKTRFIV